MSSKLVAMKNKETKLTYEMAKDIFIYDRENGYLYNKKRKHRQAGTITNRNYRAISINGLHYLAHRIVWLLENKSFPTGFIDHINGDRLDNRIVNLRAATTRQNGQNRKEHRSGKLVGAQKLPNNRWMAYCYFKKTPITVASFDTEKQAHECYLKGVDFIESNASMTLEQMRVSLRSFLRQALKDAESVK